jgi:Zn finger protein HypA/HybF involved in hydrogenase expression
VDDLAEVANVVSQTDEGEGEDTEVASQTENVEGYTLAKAAQFHVTDLTRDIELCYSCGAELSEDLMLWHCSLCGDTSMTCGRCIPSKCPTHDPWENKFLLNSRKVYNLTCPVCHHRPEERIVMECGK